MPTDPGPPLLYLVHRIPWPPNKGDKLRSFNILRQLAERHRVYLGCFADRAEDMAGAEHLGEWCAEVHVERLRPLPARLASLRGLLTGEALSLPYYRSAAMRRWVGEVVERADIRRAMVFSGPMAQYLEARVGLGNAVIDFCDVDSAKWTQYAEHRRGPMAWLYRREGERLLAFERAVALRARAALFVTAAETELFRKLAPDTSACVGVMQNGVDAGYFSPAHVFPEPWEQGGPTVVFTGAMDYWPNIDAVCWFATEVLPRLRVLVPGVRFYVVGMNPAPAVRALAAPDVVVTGAVPDVRPYLAHASAVVAPLRVARGIQNKVLEAMAMGRAVVVSAAAASGLAGEHGRDWLAAGDARAFGECLTALLAAPATGAAIGAAARRTVEGHYSWSAHLGMLDRLLDADGDGALPAAGAAGAPCPAGAPA
ncbi:TIGR03087 family PEP-CTERM/XrtA system glycosyltransferase [Pseudothauera nasutitermitis]|uniref:TIGR03087 family PEP-CTERM/XrtA system glycosyltransferase n=2 Tax=Pseudothauera nasutitermitis TaxID=2565930 RepID=A0A4S4AVM3_9RHOO|nr:TIGR03087 family PEP-CTERM/XrtA system glycosyltransferase [Pseudothauera nasutitermitis]